MDPYCVVLCTHPYMQAAYELAAELVNEGLVACVNLLPKVTSIYKWKGDLCEDEEVLMVMKTTNNNFAKLQERVIAKHPYEVAELISLPIEQGSKDYLDWITETVSLQE